MITLFMIGNGFDLSCGMKTRYTDVYHEYIKIENSSETIQRFKREIEKNIDTWSDFEYAMSQYASVLSDEKDFIECVDDFLQYLGMYLGKQEEMYCAYCKKQEIADEIKNEMISSVGSFFTGVTKNIDYVMRERNAGIISNIRAISFNYTGVFDAYYACAHEKGIDPVFPIIHIHGNVTDPAIGMDNEDQIDTPYSITDRFRSHFIKPYFNKQYDARRVDDALSLIDRASTICVFGMSLGESDLMWRNKLIEWLGSSKENHLFLYDYELSQISYRTVQERMDIEREAKENKFQSWNVKDVESISDRFHIVCGKTIFELEKAINKD